MRMKKELTMILNAHEEAAINYEQLKIYLNYEDYFYDKVLMPFLEELGVTHRFKGSDIILKLKEESGK